MVTFKMLQIENRTSKPLLFGGKAGLFVCFVPTEDNVELMEDLEVVNLIMESIKMHIKVLKCLHATAFTPI